MQSNQCIESQEQAGDGHVDDLTTSNEAVIDETPNSEAETPNLAGLAEEIGKKAASTPKRARKNAGDLEAERQLVLEEYQKRQGWPPLAISWHLEIPLERVERILLKAMMTSNFPKYDLKFEVIPFKAVPKIFKDSLRDSSGMTLSDNDDSLVKLVSDPASKTVILSILEG